MAARYKIDRPPAPVKIRRHGFCIFFFTHIRPLEIDLQKDFFEEFIVKKILQIGSKWFKRIKNFKPVTLDFSPVANSRPYLYLDNVIISYDTEFILMNKAVKQKGVLLVA